jgi:two-component system, OmpR family, sensor histidine kinase MtrB
MRGAATSGIAGSAERPADAIVRGLRHGRRLTAALPGRVSAAFDALPALWRRSLQLRVIATTLVASGIVVSLLGWFLMAQIASAVLRTETQRTGGIAATGVLTAVAKSWVSSNPGSQTQSQMYALLSQLEPKAGVSADYSIAMLFAPGERGNPGLPIAAITRSGMSIPPGLIKSVDRQQEKGGIQSKLSYTVDNFGPAGSRSPVLGLFYGAPLGNYYQLYYFFPLTSELHSLALVRSILLLVGLALVVLLAAIAWLVTRWVVVPVRQAAQGAELLREGNLDERMRVRGSDELAALATSFNGMAASLQEKMQQLEDLSQAQRQFVSDVSHELRTPLTTIKIAADVLFASRGNLDAAAARSAELLLSQLERFEALLVDLLEISRHDANVATLDAEPVDICDLARNSADVAQQLAERRGARIEFRLPAQPCVADVDRRRVERILRNLLCNAVEHGDGKDVLVTVAGDSGAVAVAVRDYGVGLAADEVHLVFDRFWRADPARARTTGGTGLGLSIALEDARLHGGWLEVWGETGQGALFRLTLPRTAGADLPGSPLPLVPDDAELAEEPTALPGMALDGEGAVARAGAAGTEAGPHG